MCVVIQYVGKKMTSYLVQTTCLWAIPGRQTSQESPFFFLLLRGCGQFIHEPGLLSLMVLVLIGWGILANRRGRMNNEILIEDL